MSLRNAFYASLGRLTLEIRGPKSHPTMSLQVLLFPAPALHPLNSLVQSPALASKILGETVHGCFARKVLPFAKVSQCHSLKTLIKQILAPCSLAPPDRPRSGIS